jgi:hypothetical protein
MDRRLVGSHAGGIAAVAEIVVEHRHPVVRDLLALGYRLDDIGDRLPFADFLSVVLAAPPNSSIRFYAIEKQWPQTDHLLANMAEQQAGIVTINGRYPRPGLVVEEPVKHAGAPMTADGQLNMAPMSLDEFRARRERDRARAAELAQAELNPIAQ